VRRDFAPWADPLAEPFIRFDNVPERFGDQLALADLSPDTISARSPACPHRRSS